jgi:thiamine pyrophosphate-dependent acetolactate synthase large subunit-like protein
MDINGAELLAHHLGTEGVRHVVGPLPADADNTLLPLYRALADAHPVHVSARSEQGAGFIAQGIARVSGRAGVCLAANGGGVTGLLAAIADAHADAVPLVAICGRAPSAGRRPVLRTGHLVDSVTKTHFEIREVGDLVDALPEAFRVAESGRPGPVLIEVPKDVQTARLRLTALPTVATRETDADPLPVQTGDAGFDIDPRPAALLQAIAEALGPDTCVVTDAGRPQAWAAQHLAPARMRGWLRSRALGSTGFALPVAIGAALADAEAPVLALCSEASLLANAAELATLADLRLDVKLLVIDDSTPGLPQPPVALRRRFIGPARGQPPALCAVAAAFGIAASDLATAPRPLAQLRDALAQPGPALIRAPLHLAAPLHRPRSFDTAAFAAYR